MRIADTKIPIHNPWPAVVSNLVYIIAAVVVAVVGGWPAAPVSLGLILQGFGSTLFHATPGRAWWAQMADAVGIQITFSAMLVFALYIVTGSWVPYLALLVLWPIWWLYVGRVSRIAAGSVQAGGIILLGLYVIPIWQLAIPFILVAVAALLQRTGTTHSLKHSLWHLLTGTAQTLIVILFL